MLWPKSRIQNMVKMSQRLCIALFQKYCRKDCPVGKDCYYESQRFCSSCIRTSNAESELAHYIFYFILAFYLEIRNVSRISYFKLQSATSTAIVLNFFAHQNSSQIVAMRNGISGMGGNKNSMRAMGSF